MNLLNQKARSDLYRFNLEINKRMHSFCEALKILDIETFFYEVFYTDGRFYSIGTHMDWSHHLIDNCGRNSVAFMKLLDGSDTSKRPKGFQWPTELLDERLKDLYQFKIWNGLSFYKIHSDRVEAWQFSTDPTKTSVLETYNDQRKYECLEIFIDLFNLHAADLIDHQNKLILPSFADTFTLDNFEKEDSVTAFKKALNVAVLAPQEREVLSHMRRGITGAKEIGRRMNLSDRTVESYVQNMMKKAGVKKSSALLVYPFLDF